MKQYFAENLKKLRREADITQDKLAEFIGVTPQTISKWERAETYPDIETLPTLANYFGVTIDELLGNDKIRTEEAIDKLIRDIHETARLGDQTKAVKMAQEGYKKYPYSYKMMDAYNDVLGGYDLYNEQYNWEQRRPEIRRVAELILEGCTDDEIRYSAIMDLCSVCEPEEREEMYKRIPYGFNFTREYWMENVYPASTDKGIALRQSNLLEWLSYFRRQVENMCGFDYYTDPDYPPADTDTKIAACEMFLAIYKGIFNKGDYLDFAFDAADFAYRLAEAYMDKGRQDDALDALKKTAEFTIMHESVPPYAKYTSFLVDHIVYDESKLGKHGGYGSPEFYIHRMKREIWNPVRSDPRFTEIEEMFVNSPRNERMRDEEGIADYR